NVHIRLIELGVDDVLAGGRDGAVLQHVPVDRGDVGGLERLSQCPHYVVGRGLAGLAVRPFGRNGDTPAAEMITRRAADRASGLAIPDSALFRNDVLVHGDVWLVQPEHGAGEHGDRLIRGVEELEPEGEVRTGAGDFAGGDLVVEPAAGPRRVEPAGGLHGTRLTAEDQLRVRVVAVADVLDHHFVLALFVGGA